MTPYRIYPYYVKIQQSSIFSVSLPFNKTGYSYISTCDDNIRKSGSPTIYHNYDLSKSERLIERERIIEDILQ